MKTKIILFAVFTMITVLCVAQTEASPTTWTMKEIIDNMPTEPVPFEGKKHGIIFDPSYSYTINNSNNTIPDRLYDNIQLTQYTHASVDPELWGVSFRKFAIPNSTNVLLIVSFGGVTDWRTDVACVINPSGQVLSTKEVAVCVMDVWVKQFRITAQNKIIVTSISPISTSSIPFGTFTSFEGSRSDFEYSINAQGQFEQPFFGGNIYNHRTYDRSYLTGHVDLWNGKEVLAGTNGGRGTNIR
jgi:hypothetical protein